MLLAHVGDVPEATSTDVLQFTPRGQGIRPELILPGLNHPHLAIRGRELPDHVWRESWQHLLEVEGALLVAPHRLATIPETHRIARLGIVVVLDQPAAAYAVDLVTLGHHSGRVGLLEGSPGAWMELAPCDPHDHSVPPSGCELECGPRARDAGALPPVCDGLMAPWACLRHASTPPPHPTVHGPLVERGGPGGPAPVSIPHATPLPLCTCPDAGGNRSCVPEGKPRVSTVSVHARAMSSLDRHYVC